jgi:hypothetical protein
MIVMLDTSHDLETAAGELGHPTEQLFTPLTRYRNRHHDKRFAIDNGAFSRFDRRAFEALLEREKERKHLCRFVAVPDVVGSARRTLEVFDYWYPLVCQWPLALVIQDGQEHLPIPWEFIAAVFIGGTTKFKESNEAIQVIKAAQAMGKWVHVGRVNDAGRFEGFRQLGVDSVDGSGIARYTWMRERIGTEPALFTKTEMSAVPV